MPPQLGEQGAGRSLSLGGDAERLFDKAQGAVAREAWGEATGYFDQAIEAETQARGALSWSLIPIHLAYAKMLHEQRAVTKAITQYERVTLHPEATGAPERVEQLLQAMAGLAELHGQQGNFRHALKLVEDAHGLALLQWGQSSEQAKALANQRQQLQRQSDLPTDGDLEDQRAQSWLQHGDYARISKVDAARIKSQLKEAEKLARNGQLERARPLFQQAEEWVRQRVGADHRDTRYLRQAIVRIVSLAGAHQEAKELGHALWQERLSSLGADHRETLDSLAQMARLYLEEGDADGFGTISARLLEGAERHYGLESQQRLKWVLFVIRGWQQLARYRAAHEMAEHALALLTERGQEADLPYRLTLMDLKAASLLKLGKHTEAAQVIQQLLTYDHALTTSQQMELLHRLVKSKHAIRHYNEALGYLDQLMTMVGRYMGSSSATFEKLKRQRHALVQLLQQDPD
uniref:MalT-like TPR region domain-containing protein n=1 Tax=Magnetococcus massalia (strain MO-1) TaxID=451514 RepID=A0A1S7LI37_MAGMO|nr:Protein of unknown function [Candidatus Magnetococcus massalia]